MASKKRTKTMDRITGQAVAVPTAKAVTTGGWRDHVAASIAADKKAVAMLPQATGNFLSFRNGVISLGGNQLENPFPAVILANGYERSYFSKPFQDGVAAVPDCYSFDDVKPHEKASAPQHDNCAQCRWNQWGSAQNAKGKMCKEGARFALLHGNQIKTAATVAAAPLVQAKLSVLNSKGFKSYIENVYTAEDRPTWTAVTMIECVPDSKSQYAVSFRAIDMDEPDDDVLDAITARLAEARKLILQAYTEIEAPPARNGGKPTRARKF